MIKKLFKIFLITIFLSSFIIWPNLSFAATPPSGLTPCGGIQSLAVLLDWRDETVHHYELYYKKTDETNWTDRYPSTSQYQVTGLSPAEDYQWYVVSCGDPACADKAESSICSFTTEELSPPPNGGNGVNGGNGGIIGLLNPLEVNTLLEAINALINFLFILAMAISPILIIYAAYLILTAGGDAAKISKARTIILWTLIALAIILFAKGLPAVIKGAFGG